MVTGVQFNGDATILATSSLDGSTTLCDVEVSVHYHFISTAGEARAGS